MAHLAQAAEDSAYRRTLATDRATERVQLDALDVTLWALDPAWAQDAPGRFYAQHPEGAADPTRRSR